MFACNDHNNNITIRPEPLSITWDGGRKGGLQAAWSPVPKMSTGLDNKACRRKGSSSTNRGTNTGTGVGWSAHAVLA